MNTNYSVPLTVEEQEQLLKEFAVARRENERARRKIQNLEKASKFLVTMNENAERVRDLNEKEILKNKQKAEEASQAKSTFLAQMSHEMRTPMNAIKVLSELLLRTDLDKLQKDYAKNIVTASATLLNIINDILDFSKLDANMFEVVSTPYDVTSLIDDVSNIINLRALDKNIAFITEIDPSIPSMLVGDDLRLKQIFMNLLQNAVKFTQEGYVKLSLRAEHGDGKTVVLHGVVEDTGIGIRKDNQSQLFEPFSQVDLIKNRQAEGTGLGLTITKQLLGLMGGEISLNSVYGKGSRFFFKVPQQINDSTPIAKVSDPGSKRVLVAADIIKSKACVSMLENLGITADVVHNAEAFCESINAHTYTHIIYYYDMFHASVVQNDKLLKKCRMVSIKDIRYAGKQQTRQSISVLFEPILIHEMARMIDYAENAQGYDFYSDANEIGRFTVKDVRALIVDDNEVNLMVMKQLLDQYNMEAILAINGMEALDVTKGQKFDIIFMDHMMPIMNGVEATKKIRAEDNPNKETPIIIVTANAIVGMKEEFLREGLDDYISKPIEIKELNAVLKKWVPAEKIVDASDLDNEDEESANTLFLQGMSGIGINATEICDSMGYNIETYIAIIDTFISSVPDTLDKLTVYRDEQNYDSFRIDVHGIKSALANIGAKKLSKAAARLESAAAQENSDFINNSFPEFYDELSDLVGSIREFKPLMEAQTKPEIQHSDKAADDQTIRGCLNHVMEALESLDSLQALESLVDLSSKLSADQLGEVATTLDEIKVNIENFDYEAATEQIHNMMHVYSA